MGGRVLSSLLLALALVLALPAVSQASISWSADLEISLEATPDTVVGGSEVSFVAEVENEGPNDAINVVVSDTLPPGAIFVPEHSSGSCVADQLSVTCSLGTLPDDSEFEVVIAATMPCVSDDLVDQASVTADTPDPNMSNNSDEATVTVQTPCQGVNQEVEDGGKVTTDPDHLGTDPSLGIFETAAFVVPAGVSGDVSLQLSTDGGGSVGIGAHQCPGFTDLILTSDQPAGDGQHRLRLVFTYDACAIPPGTKIRDTTISKSTDGDQYVDIPRCQGESWPDPCVRRKRVLSDGDFRYRVLWSGIGDPSWRPH